MTYTQLPGAAALAYAEALDLALSNKLTSKTGFSFNSKTRNERRYWYLQHVLGDQRKQYYLGEDSPELQATMARQKARWAEGEKSAQILERAVAVAIAAGCTPITNRPFKVLNALAQSSYFDAGAILIGSFAFIALGNMLGARWQPGTVQTQDLDFLASDRAMLVLPGKKPIAEVIFNMDEGIRAVPMLDPQAPSVSYTIRGSDFRVDLITHLEGSPGQGPKYVRAIDGHAQPLVFMDYLLHDAQKALLLFKAGVLVNVPTPARYALHKLIVSQRRPPAEAAKALKDIAQASQLVAYLLDQRPGDLWLALDAAKDYPGNAFTRDLTNGIKKLERRDHMQILLDYLQNTVP